MPGGRIGDIYGLGLCCGQARKQDEKSSNRHTISPAPYSSCCSATLEESIQNTCLGKLAIKSHLYSTDYFTGAILVPQWPIYPLFDRRLRSPGQRHGPGSS